MMKLTEGNVYNVQTETSQETDASTKGLEAWKKEVRKQLHGYLIRNKTQNVDAIVKATFGTVLD